MGPLTCSMQRCHRLNLLKNAVSVKCDQVKHNEMQYACKMIQRLAKLMFLLASMVLLYVFILMISLILFQGK